MLLARSLKLLPVRRSIGVSLHGCTGQVGLLEMKVCAERTGGLIVLADSFGQSVFKESLRRVFRRFPEETPGDAGQLQMGFAATLEVVDGGNCPPHTETARGFGVDASLLLAIPPPPPTTLPGHVPRHV